MIKRILERWKEQWKQEWFSKESAKLAEEFKPKGKVLVDKFENELHELRTLWVLKKDMLLAKIKLDEQEVQYRVESLESRKRELVHLDMEVKTQIKMMEAKTNPSFVWETAFTAGATKTWDLISSIVTQNNDKIIKSIKEEAAIEAIDRLRKDKK